MLIQHIQKITLAARLILLSPVLIISLAFARASAAEDNYLAEEALISALRDGGFNLYFRHEATNWSQSDHVQKYNDWLSCDGNRIRQLSESGRKSAKATGRAIKTLGIPIGKVMASPYCRTVETANLMDLGFVEPTNEVINMRVSEYFGGRAAIIASAQALLATKPANRTNRLIVAHGNVAQAATPVYPGEGEGVVFKPDSKGNFLVVGRLTPANWIRLSQAPGQ